MLKEFSKSQRNGSTGKTRRENQNDAAETPATLGAVLMQSLGDK
jgi:hypothetical protein